MQRIEAPAHECDRYGKITRDEKSTFKRNDAKHTQKKTAKTFLRRRKVTVRKNKEKQSEEKSFERQQPAPK